jgi:hypothetical protein
MMVAILKKILPICVLTLLLMSAKMVSGQSGTSANITRIEYYIDNDPGVGNATAVTIIPSVDIEDATIPFNPNVLSEGIHRVYVRARNANGNWSLSNFALFFKPYGTIPGSTATTVSKHLVS